MASDEIMVKADGVGKRYRLGVTDRKQLTDEFKAFVYRLRGKEDPTSLIGSEVDQQRIGEDFWALRDISFEVKRGEVLGIIGHNGAGKSTLLKLLSRITLPTEGIIGMKGKVSSLLEVGTGFHPELTGRDNIYLNGAILGMRRSEVDRKLEDIVAFSGIEHHLDTPVKRYSSGMRVRLGFAVAAHLEPEVLIVDEVLSVGDAEFQRKSMGKMKDSAASGRTVLFVSHNMTAMRSLCDRVIWLDHGRVRMSGPTEEVVSAYLSRFVQSNSEIRWSDQDAPGNAIAKLLHIRVSSPVGDGSINWGDPVDVEIGLDNRSTNGLSINLRVVNSDDMVGFTTNLSEGMPDVILSSGKQVVACRFPPQLFNAGEYRLNVGIVHNGLMVFQRDHVVSFTIVDPPRIGSWHGKRMGIFRLDIPWELRP
ncbi:MAG: ABC transporter ATP-binding protein [Flavobacteriales bacterium]